MKQGTTTTIKVHIPEITNIDSVKKIIFSFSDNYKMKEDKSNVLLTRNYPEEVTFIDNVFKIGLTQNDTNSLPTTFYIEGQVEFKDKSVVKTETKRYIMSQTVNTTMVDGNTPNGTDGYDLEMNIEDVIEQVSCDYDDLDNKPSINGHTLTGNKTAEELGLVDSTEFDSLAEQVEQQGEDIETIKDDVAQNKDDIVDLQDDKADKDALAQEVLNRADADDILDGKIEDIKVSFGNGIEASVNPQTYVCTFNLKNGNTVLSTATIDLPLESVVVSGTYDSQTKEVVLTLESGSEVRFSVADLVSGLQNQLTTSNGIDITNDTISVVVKSGTHLFFDSGELSTDAIKAHTYVDNNVSSYTNFVDGDLLIDSSHKVIYQAYVNVGDNTKLDVTHISKDSVKVSFQDHPSAEVVSGAYLGCIWVKITGSPYSPTIDKISICTSQYMGALIWTDIPVNVYTKTETDTLLSDKQNKIDNSHKLDADLVDDSEADNKFVSAADKAKIDTYNPIKDSAKGTSIALTDSVASPLDEIYVMCKSTQNGTPSIDNPIPIVDITAEEIEITDGTDTQTANLDIVLRGIPVTSGGNYTDNNNQQWICDTIERYADGTGKLIRRVGVVDNSLWVKVNVQQGTVGERYVVSCGGKANTTVISNYYPFRTGINSYIVEGDYVVSLDDGRVVARCKDKVFGDITDMIEWATVNLITIFNLETPIETPLTAEQLAELDLDTYYPTTSINSNADVVVEYVADTKNYIDKKTSALESAILSLGGNI